MEVWPTICRGHPHEDEQPTSVVTKRATSTGCTHVTERAKKARRTNHATEQNTSYESPASERQAKVSAHLQQARVSHEPPRDARTRQKARVQIHVTSIIQIVLFRKTRNTPHKVARIHISGAQTTVKTRASFLL